MNDEWIDKLRAERVDTDPRPGFKDELRATIVAEHSGVTASNRPAATGGRRWWVFGAAAGCVGLLIAGLLVFGGNDSEFTPSTMPGVLPVSVPETVPGTHGDPSTSTAPKSVAVTTIVADTAISDTGAISLDEWIDPDVTPSVPVVVVVIDRQALPAGWSVSNEAGQLYVPGDDMLGYQYTAAVTTDDQAAFDVTFARDTFIDPCFIPVSEFPGTVGDLTGATVGEAVCGQTDDGTGLAVVPSDDSATATRWSALDVADRLSFVQADEVPHPDLTVVAGEEEPADVDFAGTLSGIRWAITVEPSGTRPMYNYIAGVLSTGMELSQEGLDAGQPTAVVESTLDGVPGYGTIAYGHVDGDAVAAIVTTNDGRTVRLPMLPSDRRSAFAVPIPDTVDVAIITFISDTGSVLVVADVPDIPAGFVSGTLGLTTGPSGASATNAPASPSVAPFDTSAETVRDAIVAMLVDDGWTEIGGDHDITGSATFGLESPNGTVLTGHVLLGATEPVGDTPVTATITVADHELLVLGERATFATCGDVGITFDADTLDESSKLLTAALNELEC